MFEFLTPSVSFLTLSLPRTYIYVQHVGRIDTSLVGKGLKIHFLHTYDVSFLVILIVYFQCFYVCVISASNISYSLTHIKAIAL